MRLVGGRCPCRGKTEKDAENSRVPADAVCLPDFETVTDEMRYVAIGA